MRTKCLPSLAVLLIVSTSASCREAATPPAQISYPVELVAHVGAFGHIARMKLQRPLSEEVARIVFDKLHQSDFEKKAIAGNHPGSDILVNLGLQASRLPDGDYAVAISHLSTSKVDGAVTFENADLSWPRYTHPPVDLGDPAGRQRNQFRHKN